MLTCKINRNKHVNEVLWKVFFYKNTICKVKLQFYFLFRGPSGKRNMNGLWYEALLR